MRLLARATARTANLRILLFSFGWTAQSAAIPTKLFSLRWFCWAGTNIPEWYPGRALSFVYAHLEHCAPVEPLHWADLHQLHCLRCALQASAWRKQWLHCMEIEFALDHSCCLVFFSSFLFAEFGFLDSTFTDMTLFFSASFPPWVFRSGYKQSFIEMCTLSSSQCTRAYSDHTWSRLKLVTRS